MTSIGLDLGTSYVKCVSDNDVQVTFPAIYAYTFREKWDDDRTILAGVGEDAMRIAAYPDATIIRPIIEGRPVHKKGTMELVKTTKKKLENIFTDWKQVDCVIAGLPYDANDKKQMLNGIITEVFHPDKCIIVPQAIGTIESLNKRSSTVIDIGQGTTEIVAIEDMQILAGQSIMQGCDFITRDLGEYAFLNKDVFQNEKDRLSPKIDMMADLLSNKLESFMSTLKPMFECSSKVILSGGGSLIPGLKEKLDERMGDRIYGKIETPLDPIMSNALGLYKLATRRGVY